MSAAIAVALEDVLLLIASIVRILALAQREELWAKVGDGVKG
jgi:hypothetical protein